MNRREMAAREYLAGNALGEVAQKYAVSMKDVLEAAAKIPRQKVRAKIPRKGGANVITQTNICMECAKACGKCSWTAVAADGGNAAVAACGRMDGRTRENKRAQRERSVQGN